MMRLYHGGGARSFTTVLCAELADTCAQSGRVDEALDAVAAGFDHVQQHNERFYESCLYHLRGTLHLRQGNTSRALADFEQAQRLAALQGLRLIELRAILGQAQAAPDLSASLATRCAELKAELETMGMQGTDVDEADRLLAL